MKKYGEELIGKMVKVMKTLFIKLPKMDLWSYWKYFFTSYDMNTLKYDENTIYPIAEQNFMDHTQHRIRILHQKWPLWKKFSR